MSTRFRRVALLTLFIAAISSALIVLCVFLVIEKSSYDNTQRIIDRANFGEAREQRVLGFLFQTGQRSGVIWKMTYEDESKAIYWYEKAARQGEPFATERLASIYENSQRHQDYKKSLFYYKKSAENGSVDSLNRLIKIYSKGELGEPINRAEADRFRRNFIAKHRVNSDRSKD